MSWPNRQLRTSITEVATAKNPSQNIASQQQHLKLSLLSRTFGQAQISHSLILNTFLAAQKLLWESAATTLEVFSSATMVALRAAGPCNRSLHSLTRMHVARPRSRLQIRCFAANSTSSGNVNAENSCEFHAPCFIKIYVQLLIHIT